ncbi:MAG: LPS export ABC transporter ATP-binding protein, partial [Candidatus Omnitrophica bacterium]|nr:LPS export ABC transporter ATP-binding protein [Candidatus Omnitrophota bacterium]
MKDQEPLITAGNLMKSYGDRTVVDGVDVQVRRGEIVGLLGPNGAGKTTVFYMLVGFIKADGGKITFDGQEITHLPMYQRARQGIGFLAQEPSVFRRMTVAENVMAILETLPLTHRQRLGRLEKLLAELNLSSLAKNLAYTLSGGERRRLEITRALVTEPQFLLLDEPFSGIDPIAVYEAQDIIRGLKEKGLGILLTDHNVRETLAITDRSYLMA